MSPALQRAFALVALAAGCVISAGVGSAGEPVLRRALVIGIDGLTGSELQRYAFAEGAGGGLRSLMDRGVFARCERAADPGCARAHDGPRAGDGFRYETASGWASVVTGMNSPGHGVQGNAFDEQAKLVETSRRHPTLFRSLREHGLRSAAGGVANFLTSRDGDGVDSGIVDFECGVATGVPNVAWDDRSSCNLDWRRADDVASERRDDDLAAWLVERIDDRRADLIMGVFDEVDGAGHSHGFEGSAGYRAAIAVVDELVSGLLARVRSRVERFGESWLVALTSDHGGHDVLFGLYGMHDTRLPDDSAVPFVVAAFGASRPLLPLVSPVRQMDLHPTVLAWFGIDPGDVDGVVQAIHRDESDLPGSVPGSADAAAADDQR